MCLVVVGLSHLVSGFGKTGIPALDLPTEVFATLPLAIAVDLLLKKAAAGIPAAFVISLLRGGFERTVDIDDLA